MVKLSIKYEGHAMSFLELSFENVDLLIKALEERGMENFITDIEWQHRKYIDRYYCGRKNAN